MATTLNKPTSAVNEECGRHASPLNVAIIGGGMIAEQHLESLTSGLPHVSVTGICDLSPALAQFNARRFNIPYWTSDHHTMLDAVDADVVHVLTPPATHVPIVRDCLDHGMHVVVEKPIAPSNVELRKLWSHARRRRVYLTESHNYRFNAPVLRLERLIREGRLGAVEEVEIRMALNIRERGRYADPNFPHPSHQLPAGVIHEFITHLCYLLLHFLPDANDIPEVVRAAWRNHGGGTLFKFDDLDAFLISGNTHARIRFSSRTWPDAFVVQVRGSEGIATAELFQPSWQFVPRRSAGPHLTTLINAMTGAGSLVASGYGSFWRKIRNLTPYEGLSRFLQITYDAIARGEHMPIGFREMDRSTRLIDSLLAPEHQI